MECPFCIKSCGNDYCSYNTKDEMKTVKMYRHTIKHTEYIGDDDYIITYDQTNWGSIPNYIPGESKEVVLIEEKAVHIEEKKK